MSFTILSSLLVFLAFTTFAARRMLTYLHLFQQEEYDGPRFIRWIIKKRVIDRYMTMTLVLFNGIGFLPFIPDPIKNILYIAVFLAGARFEHLARAKAKKKLVFTTRAKRILFLALFFVMLTATLPLIPSLSEFQGLLFIVCTHVIPFALVLSTLCLQPMEKNVQKKFWKEGHDKLNKLNPTVIGITGSFGKTSVKHILGHILQSAAPTLITPGSVNTVMGITRIIRERLEPRHKWFIAEMGAYGPGSIKRLCDLAPPDIGVITAIGAAHYERFKSLMTVAEAKYELAEAVRDKNGKMIVHDSTLNYDKPMRLRAEHPDMFVVCGKDDPAANLTIKDIRQSSEGLEVDITWNGADHTLKAPLYGQHHGSNMALAFATACTLGVPEKHILTALKTTPQITHRLEVKPNGAGLLIDDAYNSNPQGFASALEILNMLGKERNARRILVTPGMVELGDAHDKEHDRLGALAGQTTDIVLAIGAERIASFTKSVRDHRHSLDQQIIELASFDEAKGWLAANGLPDDIILLENDLPDLFENIPKM